MANRKLTDKQREILEYLKECILQKGYPPAVREICEAVHLKSTSSVHAHLESLEEKGYIRKDPTKPRAIEILDDETEQRIKEYIHSKNFFGLTEFVNTLEIPEERKTALKSFESLFGGLDMLDHAEKLVTNAASLEAIARMRKVYTALTSYGYEKYVSFDLSMINRFNYYTGIVFRGYTYGTGDAIVKGGRYNSLMEKFGKKAPSVGFAIYVDDLMSAIARNKIDVALDYSNVLVLYKEEDQKEAIAYACKLRAEDQKVELVRMSRRHDLQEYIDYAHKMHFAKLCYFEAADKITEY